MRDPSPGPDNVWGTRDDDYGDLRLQATSPCVDMGVPTARPIGQDLGGHPRLLDGDLDGAMRVDMGAHEFGHVRLTMTTPLPNRVVLVFSGTAGLPVLLGIGSPSATGFMLAPLGELYLNPAQPMLIVAVGSLPQTLSLAYQSGTHELAVQAVALGGKGGTLSNPQFLSVR